MIGYFGEIVFETSDQRILTFSSLKHDSAGRWETHNVINQKPVMEFIGPDVDSITFTIDLNASNGVKPRDEIERWLALVRNGTADVLVIGTKVLGVDKWTVKQISNTWNTVFNKGELYSAKIDVTLQEYVEVVNT